MQQTTMPFLNYSAPDDAPALFDDQSTAWLSYGELRYQTEFVAEIFNHTDKKLIFCCTSNNSSGVIAYLAAARSGHATAMIDSAHPQLNKLIENYQPEWIIAPDNINLASASYKAKAFPLTNLKLWQANKFCEASIHADLYLLLLTSGSSGDHKAVRLSYRNLQSNSEAIIASLNLTSDARALLHLPLAYSFGLSVLHCQLAIGGSAVLSQHSMIRPELWALARAQKINLFAGVPYHYELLQKLDLDRLNLPELEIFLQAGGALPIEITKNIWKKVTQRNGRFFVMYGQTEAAPRMTCLPLHSEPDKIGSVGYAIRGGKISIENGEIIYCGPNVMMGFAEQRSDLAKDDLQKGKLATGDLGTLDASGCLTITGRMKRIAKLYGNRISLENLEQIAKYFAPCIVIEAADKIIVYCESTDKTLGEQIKEALVNQTGLAANWLEVRAIDKIPYLANGKIDYQSLQKIHDQ